MSPARPSGPARLATYFHVHLVSDSTGETLNAMAKAVTARFDGVIPIEHIYSLVRSEKQMERVLQEVESAPGVVLHTLVDRDLREQLEEGCRRLDMPQIGALDPLVGAMSRYLGAALSTRVGAQHALDHDYFNRIAALDFAMAYDDGQGSLDQLEGADVVLCGVSRTSKTPTCIYLALHYGVRAANYPLTDEDLEQDRLPPRLRPYRKKLFGLTIDPDRLQQIRQERRPNSRYANLETCRREVAAAETMFRMERIPTLSTTHTSIEEISSKVLGTLGLQREMY